ncbi:MAG: hypothetical protein U9O98_07465 [Asgard group archaeon]|nr:hypothetical protein [Asgard group archaeon]
MVKSTLELIIISIQITILTIIMRLFLYRRIKLKIRALNWLIVIFGIGALQGIYELIFYCLIKYAGMTSLEKYNDTHFIIYGVALLVLFVFLECLEHAKPRFWTTTIAFSFWGIFVSTYLFDLITNPQRARLEDYFGIYFFEFLQIFVIGYAMMVFYRIYNKSKYQPLKTISLLFVIAFVAFEIVSILELTEHWTTWDIPNMEVFTVVFLYVAVIYFIFPYYIYLVPHDIHNLILLNSNGLVIYNCQVGEHETTKDSALLMGGAVTGLETFLKSIFRTEDRLKRIQMTNMSLIMIGHENMVAIAIVEKLSFILRTAMQQLIQESIQKFPELNKQEGQIYLDEEKIAGIVKIISRVFPFIQSKEVFPIDIKKISKNEQADEF